MSYRNGSNGKRNKWLGPLIAVVIIVIAGLAYVFRGKITNATGGLLGPTMTISPSTGSVANATLITVTAKGLPKSATAQVMLQTQVAGSGTLVLGPGTASSGYNVPTGTDATGAFIATFPLSNALGAGATKVTVTAGGQSATGTFTVTA